MGLVEKRGEVYRDFFDHINPIDCVKVKKQLSPKNFDSIKYCPDCYQTGFHLLNLNIMTGMKGFKSKHCFSVILST